MMSPYRHLRLTLAALASLIICATPALAVDLYWDVDNSAVGNNVSGNGLGGTGTWGTVNTSFWNPLSPGANVVWSNGNQVVFSDAASTGGEVTIDVGQTRTVTGLVFNTPNFKVTGTNATSGTLGTTAFGTTTANLYAAPNVVGKIGTRLTGTGGFNVSGGGTIRIETFRNVNSTTGPVSVTGNSTLELQFSGQIGGTGAGSGAITLDGGTLRNTNDSVTVANNNTVFLATNRNLVIGPNGGTVIPQGTGTYSGIISGGVLTKSGPGEFRFSGAAAQLNTHEKTIVTDGMLSIGTGTTVGVDRNMGAVPSSFMPDNLTLAGGTIFRFLGDDLLGLGNDTINLNANRGITVNGSATLNNFSAHGVINGGISGPGSITKLGTYRLTLGGNSTYSGGTLISNGSLRVTNTTGSATGSEFVILDSGTLDGTGTIAGVVEAAANTRIAAGLGGANATLTLGGLTTAGNLTTIDSLLGENTSDVLRITNPGGLNFSNGALLNLGGSSSTGDPGGKTLTVIDYTTSYSGDINTNLLLNNATGYSATLSDSGSSIDVTLGTILQDKEWELDGSGNWSESTAESNNWDDPGRPNGPGTSARFLSAATAPVTVTISDFSKAVGTLQLDNANKYTIASASTARLVFSTYEGKASLEVVSGSHEISSRVTFTTETDIRIPAGIELNMTGVNATGITGIINNGGINVLGGGTLAINQNWTGTGATNITEGTLKYAVTAGGIGNSSDVSIGAAGTLDMNLFNDTFGSLSGSGPILNGGNVTLSGSNSTPKEWNGNFSGTNASRVLTKNGPGIQILGGSNDFTDSTVGGGSLLVNNTSGFALGITGLTTVAANATLGGDGTLGNRVSVSAGGIIAPGAGGANSIGTLTLDSAVPTTAILGLATATSQFSFDLGASLTSDTIALVNAAAGDIVFTNNVINFTDTTSGSLTTGDYTLFSSNVASSYAGTFAVDGSNLITAGLAIGTGLTAYESAVLKLVGNDIVLSLTAASNALLGDFNDDGIVNLADYTVWRDNLGATEGELLSGNGTGGIVDGDDYAVWKGNFGATSPGSLNIGGSVTVPEPSTVFTLLAGFAVATCFARNRHFNS